jgi:hypothetical protein
MSATMSRGAFYAEGLRWIASLLTAAADRLDRLQRPAELAPLEPLPRLTPRDEALYDLRNRLTNTW